MKRLCLVLTLFATQGCSPDGAGVPARPEDGLLATCQPEQLLGFVPEPEEVEKLRKFVLPTIDYPQGTGKKSWGFSVTLLVDGSGVPVCHALRGSFGDEVPLDDQRTAFVEQLRSWRYGPLVRDGQAVPMVVTEQVREQEQPAKHVPLPLVPLSQVRIVLIRSGCFGTCPGYRVELRGDGSVQYQGDGFVDVVGEHRYRVPVADVASLVESLRDKDIWSMRPSYRASITDNPTYRLTIDMGGQVREIEDYVGEMVGMPAAVTDFEDEVDAVARSAMWIRLSGDAVDQLQHEGFAFDSTQGANLLARAVGNREGRDDAAMARLVALGTPVHGAQMEGWRQPLAEMPLIESALRNRRVALIAPLVAAGALETDGRQDQGKLDAAFRAAIQGGSLAAVREIWDLAGAGRHPRLDFIDEDDSPGGGPVRKRVPVTLLLSGAYQPQSEWQGLEIARWLVARGCDIAASRVNGDTLLHIAAETNDVAFVRYLLGQGLDASAPGEFGLPPLGGATNEEIALLLLEAGTDLRMMDGGGRRFVDYARDNHWGRVVNWLQSRDHVPEGDDAARSAE